MKNIVHHLVKVLTQQPAALTEDEYLGMMAQIEALLQSKLALVMSKSDKMQIRNISQLITDLHRGNISITTASCALRAPVRAQLKKLKREFTQLSSEVGISYEQLLAMTEKPTGFEVAQAALWKEDCLGDMEFLTQVINMLASGSSVQDVVKHGSECGYSLSSPSYEF